MAYSCAPSNVGSDHVDPTVPQLVGDLPSGLTIKVPIYTLAAINWYAVLGDLLIALKRISRS